MKPTKLLPADHGRVVYTHTPEFETPIAETFKSEYWEHVAKQLRPGDRIEILSADGKDFASLIVRAASRKEVLVGVIEKVTFSAAKPLASETPYYVKYRGPSARYSVLSKADDEVIKANFQSEEEAMRWLDNHQKAMAA